jgi:geranylgeranyl diphosphate synthase, type I
MKRILSYGPMLKRELRSYIRAKKPGTGESIPWGRDFLERFEPFATSGKLLRGSVLCFAYETFSGKPPDKAAVRAAMALELTHSALLIHDDIMDEDDTRRGRPSMHAQYRRLAASHKLSKEDRFGTNMALSGGDAALFMAMELLSRSQACAAAGAEAYPVFVEQLLKTCAGQMQDVYFDARPASPSKNDILSLMRNKTAGYTLALPLAMGASLAGEPASVLRRLQAIGEAGGTIFQIRDDELGIVGDESKTGKPVGSDIKEGKKTLIHYYLARKCSPEELIKANAIFGNSAATAGDISYIRGLVRLHRIAGLLSEDIDRLRRKAFMDIDKLAADGSSKDELKELIAFCARRQY